MTGDKGEVLYIYIQKEEKALEKGEENSNKEKRKKNQSPAL